MPRVKGVSIFMHLNTTHYTLIKTRQDYYERHRCYHFQKQCEMCHKVYISSREFKKFCPDCLIRYPSLKKEDVKEDD